MWRGAVVVVLLVELVSTAAAQADTAWDRGIALREQGRDAEALAVFEQAHRDAPSSRLLAQIALAEGALGRWNDAARHLDEALAAPDDWIARNRSTLESTRAEIARHTTSAEPSNDGALPIAGGVLLGVAAASAVAMAITWALREGDAAKWNSDACWPIGSTREEACPDVDDSVDRATVATVVLGVGALAFAGVGIAMIAAGGASGGETAFVCAPGLGIGIVCAGRF
jgi:hypothetical protein